MTLTWCGHSGANAAFCTLFNGSGKVLPEVLAVADAISPPMAGPGVDGNLSQHGSVRMSLQWGCSRTRNLLLRRVCHAALIRDQFWPKNYACRPPACPGIQQRRRRHAATPLTQGSCPAFASWPRGWQLRGGICVSFPGACRIPAPGLRWRFRIFCRQLPKAGLSESIHHIRLILDPSSPLQSMWGDYYL